MTIIGKYTVTQSFEGFRITWIEANAWNTLFTADFTRVALIINRLNRESI